MIKPFQDDTDQFSIEADGSKSDGYGHGTGMAGLAIWGDLTDALESDEPVHVRHRIESVRMLDKPGDNEGRHHGIMTADAVSLVEIANPDHSRVFAMAVSTTDGRDRGRPSAWSGSVDSLASDALGEGAFPRLFLVAGGNTGDDLVALKEYPDHNQLQDIHDPGQAWNALTVGAYTAKTTITEQDCSAYQPLAPEGGLSPYSTTSTTWDKTMPLKPDLVFEGGNVGLDSLGCAGMPSLKLLTTHNNPLDRLFTTFEATSAATALASRFAAEIRAEYPDWLLGRERHRGSIHKDIGKGKAAALAERGQIAVFPAMGWWRTRKSLQRYDKKARYALVVSIRAPEVDVDLYSEVLTQVSVPQSVET